jgi:hypothetical protein
MSEWWTYRLTSFLLFSPRTYHRLFELYNVAIWPLQILALAIGVAIVALLLSRTRHRDRTVAGLLAICWLWAGWAFLYGRYAQVNWVAPWFALAFVLEGLLLVGFGVLGGHVAFDPAESVRTRIAAALAALVVVGYPLLAPAFGRAWTTAEIFGVAPDPTVLATVSALAVGRGWLRVCLLMIPLLWCAITIATLRAMREPEAIVVGAAAIAIVALALAARSRRTGR